MKPYRDPNRPKVPDVVPLIRELYASPRGGAGCCLHITLDDGNVDDGNLDFCITWAKENGHPLCIKVATMMRAMTKTQRIKLSSMPKRVRP